MNDKIKTKNHENIKNIQLVFHKLFLNNAHYVCKTVQCTYYIIFLYHNFSIIFFYNFMFRFMFSLYCILFK